MFPSNLVAYLNEEENPPVDDVTIKDRQGAAHLANKALLAAKSQFFKSLFCWSDCKEFSVDLDEEGLAASLAWVVTGEVELKEENAVDVMIAADYLTLMELSSHCQQWVAARVENTNLVNLWLLAQQFGLDELSKACLEFASSCKRDVVENLEMLGRDDNITTTLALPKEQIFAFGGVFGEQFSSSIYCFNLADRSWDELETSLPAPMSRMGAAVLGDRVFVCGGHKAEALASRHLLVFDPVQQQVRRLSSMRQDRLSPTVVAVASQGKVYVVGGFASDFEILDSVEVYDVETNQWSVANPMNQPRVRAAGVVLGDCIYIIGGHGDGDMDGTALLSVECLNLTTGQWKEVQGMATGRLWASATVWKGKICVMGGSTHHNPDLGIQLSTGEVYDPDTNLWTTLPNFTIPRVDYFLTVLEGKLTAVDIYSFEVLEEGDNIWTYHEPSGAELPYFNFISFALLPISM